MDSPETQARLATHDTGRRQKQKKANKKQTNKQKHNKTKTKTKNTKNTTQMRCCRK